MTLQDGTLEEFGYEWVVNSHNGGGTYETGYYPYPWRIVLHEIQGGASTGSIQNHPYPPHVWYDPISRRKWQTVPLTRSAFALYQGDQEHYTNKARALQVEIAGFTDYASDETDQMLRNIAEDVVVPMVLFVRSQGDDIDLTDCPGPPASLAGAASEDWPGRFGDQRWADFAGLGSHLRVPGNDHWDVGAMDVPKIARYAADILGDAPPPGPKEPFTVGQYEELNARLDRVNNQVDRVIFYLDALARNGVNQTAGETEVYPLSRAMFDLHGKANVLLGDAATTIRGVNDSYANLNAQLGVAQKKLDVIGRAVTGTPPAATLTADAIVAPSQPTGRQQHELQRQKDRIEAEMAAAAVPPLPGEDS